MGEWRHGLGRLCAASPDPPLIAQRGRIHALVWSGGRQLKVRGNGTLGRRRPAARPPPCQHRRAPPAAQTAPRSWRSASTRPARVAQAPAKRPPDSSAPPFCCSWRFPLMTTRYVPFSPSPRSFGGDASRSPQPLSRPAAMMGCHGHTRNQRGQDPLSLCSVQRHRH